VNQTKIKTNKNTLKDDLQDKSRKNAKNESLMQKQKEILTCMNQSLEMNQKYVWQGKPVDEEFYKYYLNMCIQMLENPLILSFLFQPLLFALSECLSHKPSYQPNLILRFINLSLEIEDNFNWIVKFLVAGFNSENCQMVGFV
jgi:hypothetical protein